MKKVVNRCIRREKVAHILWKVYNPQFVIAFFTCFITKLFLLKLINPDIIVLTGDLIDAYHTDVDVAMELIDEAIRIAPIYYVSGNHEAWSGLYDDFKSRLDS